VKRAKNELLIDAFIEGRKKRAPTIEIDSRGTGIFPAVRFPKKRTQKQKPHTPVIVKKPTLHGIRRVRPIRIRGDRSSPGDV